MLYEDAKEIVEYVTHALKQTSLELTIPLYLPGQILDEMYINKTENGGRPNCDVILMFKILILQQWDGLSDLETERQMSDSISFISFLGFPDPFPDSRTIWQFRERMAKTEKDKLVWAELQKRLGAELNWHTSSNEKDALFMIVSR